MSEETGPSSLLGVFQISPGRKVHGELTLSGAKSSLYVYDSKLIMPNAIPGRFVKGVLHDLTKVSLIDCNPPGLGFRSRGKERIYFANIFPHYVVLGDHHLSPSDTIISEAHFVVDDAATLFYDYEAFGSLIDARPFIEQIALANTPFVQKITGATNRRVRTGPDPQILYFTGKSEIFAAKTVVGLVSAMHNPRHDMGGPAGVKLDNKIVITIKFKRKVAFEDAILHSSTLLQYFGLLAGRPQNLLELHLSIKGSRKEKSSVRVHWSLSPKRDVSNEGKAPHPAEVLLDAVRQPDEFSVVLTRWLARQEEWHNARHRFFGSFAEQQRYDIDRMTGSANMFDILPDSAGPPRTAPSDQLEAAKIAAQKIFRPLPISLERESVLKALSLIGKTRSLKHKIQHRAQFVSTTVGEQFPELSLVTDEAVNCRNYYVHGGDSRIDYGNNFDTVIFLADTLEFVFAASDLIEAGWDIGAWTRVPTSMSHPFARYRVTYAARLLKLKSLRPKKLSAIS